MELWCMKLMGGGEGLVNDVVLLVVVELAWTWGMQQTVLEAGDEVAMAMT